jgi:hypothetical protein
MMLVVNNIFSKGWAVFDSMMRNVFLNGERRSFANRNNWLAC